MKTIFYALATIVAILSFGKSTWAMGNTYQCENRTHKLHLKEWFTRVGTVINGELIENLTGQQSTFTAKETVEFSPNYEALPKQKIWPKIPPSFASTKNFVIHPDGHLQMKTTVINCPRCAVEYHSITTSAVLNLNGENLIFKCDEK